MDMGKVLIVEPSEELQETIVTALGDAHALQFCPDVHAARMALADSQPDVLFLGLYDMDGLVFLQEQTENRPKTLVYTAFQGEHMANHLQRLADYVMYTPCNLVQLADYVNDMLRLGMQEVFHDDPALAFVRQLLQRPARSGYRYLIYAIALYARDTHQAVTKEIYPAVAKEFGSTAACVEKAIRTAIDQAYDERDDAIWRRYFPTDRTGQVIRPSNKAFFSIATEHIRAMSRKRA